MKARPWLIGGIATLVLPLLVTRAVPFQDAPGFLGLASVLAPSHSADGYQVDLGFYPSWLPFAWVWLTGLLHVPLDLGFNAFIALFCLAGPVLALRSTLRAFGRPDELALLALPFGFHHQIWYGFVGSAAAISGLLAALAAARLMVDRPSLRRAAALAGALLFVAGCHPFSLALTLMVVGPVVLVPGTWRDRALRAAPFLPVLIFVAGWARGFLGGGGERQGQARFFTGPRPGLSEHLTTFALWLGGGYRNHLDEIVVAVGVLGLAAFLALGVRQSEERPRWESIWLGTAAALLLAAYLILPDQVYWPTYWWGVRVRCVMPLVLVAIVAVRPARRGLSPGATVAAAVAGIAFAVYVTADFAGPWRRALNGFDEAIAAIPPGRSLLLMPALPDPHYTVGHPYLGQYYVARAGGRAVPYLGGHPGSYWVTMKPPPPSPPWGDPTQFSWDQHGGYDYFLLEWPVVDPLRDNPAVELVRDGALWRLYRKR